MKYLPFLLAVILSLCLLSCNTDNPSSEKEPDEASDPSDQNSNDDENNNEGPVSLVDAFPNISFNQPLDFQVPQDGSNKIYVAEKRGQIKVFDNNSSITETQTFLDLGSIATSSEQGLLGFTFHPDFVNNGHFYVCYTPNSSSSLVSRFTISTADSNVDMDSELELLKITQPQANHNGGQIAFGPDGYLYIAVGDGGGGGDPDGNSQNRSNLLGNILRIDVDNIEQGLNYAIPTDNPFINESSVRNEIYAYGFRNPWRMSFDTETGKLWTGDVGQNKIEEIDVVEIGGNYGWNLFEGTDCFSGNCDNANLVAPIFEYAQDNGDRSITGGYVYRGTENTTMKDKYIYGDFVSGRIWALNEDGGNNELILESRLSIASFGTDANQELYICAFDGKIYKFQENLSIDTP